MEKPTNRLKLLISIVSICFLGIFLTGTAIADTTIDTTPSWNGSDYVGSFGYPNTATYGQIITVPATDTVLQNFTFYMQQETSCTFRGYVYAWNGNRAVGPELYESLRMQTSQGISFEAVTFSIPGGLLLTAGSQYVLFASISRESGSGEGDWGYIEANPYAEGSFCYINDTSNDSLWTTIDWTVRTGDDLAFTAFFTPGSTPAIPTMNEWGMIILSLLLGFLAIIYIREQSQRGSMA